MLDESLRGHPGLGNRKEKCLSFDFTVSRVEGRPVCEKLIRDVGWNAHRSHGRRDQGHPPDDFNGVDMFLKSKNKQTKTHSTKASPKAHVINFCWSASLNDKGGAFDSDTWPSASHRKTLSGPPPENIPLPLGDPGCPRWPPRPQGRSLVRTWLEGRSGQRLMQPGGT